VSSGVILAIDTAGAFASVALGRDGVELGSAESGGEHSHSENLTGLIEKVLRDASVTFQEVRCIVLGRGPGSFTGLRIGFATVQGLSVGRAELAIHPMPSALGARSKRVLSSAGKGLVFDSQVDVARGTSSCSMRAIDAQTDSNLPVETEVVALAPIPEIAGIPVARGVASGLLAVFVSLPDTFPAVSEIAALEPDYVRSVAAKSIAERRVAAL
jgi:tRNA threonylcarbamoyl adenosine modification protein YeaZ